MKRPQMSNGAVLGQNRKVVSLDEFRAAFESCAKSAHFSIERNEHGEYRFHATFNMWVGYWQCGKDFMIISGKDADWCNAHS
jgi:hypothetical protein